MEVKLHSYAFVQSSLATLSEHERTAVFQFGHLHNEPLWSQKHLLWVWNRRENESEPETNAHVFTFLSAVQRFAGQIVEANNVIEAQYYGTGLSKHYHSALTAETQQALRSLRRYFGGKNLITGVWNNFAFHFDSEHFRAQLNALPPWQPHRFFIGEHATNTFFEFAHNVHAQAFLDFAKPDDSEGAMTRLATEITGDVPDWIFAFMSEFIIAVFRRINGVAAAITLDNAPMDSEVRLPYFTAPPP